MEGVRCLKVLGIRRLRRLRRNQRIRRSSWKTIDNQGLVWGIKWLSTVELLIGVACRSAGVYPLLDLILTASGAAGWAFVAYRWNDRALLVINSVALVMLLVGILERTVVNS